MIGAHALTIRAGITYRMADYWTRTGLLKAEPRPAGASSGTPREYSEDEARVAVTMARLVRAGVDPRAACDIARHMEATGEARLGGYKVTASKPVRRRGWHLAGRRAA